MVNNYLPSFFIFIYINKYVYNMIKPFVSVKTLTKFNSLKKALNENNNSYYTTNKNNIYDGTPDILFEQVVFIEDVHQIYTRLEFYSVNEFDPNTYGQTLEDALDDQTSNLFAIASDVANEIQKNEKVISTSLNELHYNFTYLKDDVSYLKGDISFLQGDISYLKGDISFLQGDISYLNKNISFLQGDISHIQDDIFIPELATYNNPGLVQLSACSGEDFSNYDVIIGTSNNRVVGKLNKQVYDSVVLTQSQYNNLNTKDSNTIYYIIED